MGVKIRRRACARRPRLAAPCVPVPPLLRRIIAGAHCGKQIRMPPGNQYTAQLGLPTCLGRAVRGRASPAPKKCARWAVPAPLLGGETAPRGKTCDWRVEPLSRRNCVGLRVLRGKLHSPHLVWPITLPAALFGRRPIWPPPLLGGVPECWFCWGWDLWVVAWTVA